MNKSEKMIIAAIVLLVIVLIVYFALNNGPKFVAYRTKTINMSATTTFIEDYKTFEKYVKSNGIEETITNLNDFSKSQILDVFNEEYFETKKVAIVSTYEDTSKSYAFSIDDLKYDKTKTNAIVYYTDNPGEYLGTLKSSWRNIMLVELDGSVTDVSFEKTKNEK